jgi:hypothetical protein
LIRHKHIPTAGIGEFIAAVTATPDGFTDGLTGITIITGTDTGIIIDCRLLIEATRAAPRSCTWSRFYFCSRLALTENAQAA